RTELEVSVNCCEGLHGQGEEIASNYCGLKSTFDDSTGCYSEFVEFLMSLGFLRLLASLFCDV
ncbi:hypothetical protein MKW98_016838, partial [Papaver atlanticum]